MRKAFLFGVLGSVVACAAIACQGTEDRPPISEGPGGGHGGGGSGSSDAGGGSGGDAGATTFATFTGYDVTGLAADGDTLYVTLAPLDTTQAGKVDRVAADGTVTDLVTTAVSPSLPTLYAGTLFYSDVKSGVLSTIEAVDLTATAPITPQDVVPNVQSPGAILDVDGLLFYSFVSGGVAVWSTPVGDGGAGSDVASYPGDYVPAGMASDGANVYFTASAAGASQILRVPAVGGAAESIWPGTSAGTLGNVVLSGGVLYFTVSVTGNGGGLYGVPVAGDGTSTITIANGLDTPSGLAATTTSLYFTTATATNGGLWRIGYDAPDSGTLPTIVAFVANAKYLALGSTAVYVSTDQAVIRVAQ